MDRESDIQAFVRTGQLSLPPVELRVREPGAAAKGDSRADVLIEIYWGNQAVRFLAQVKKLATPKELQQSIAMARKAASPPETYPMVVVPYLSPGKLLELEATGVSGLDLCGNGVLIVPDKMLVFRSGQPNRFPQSAKLKNVYRGKNSLVARAFLLSPEFSRVKEIVALLEHRGGRVAFSTVSKVLKRLEEELIVSRRGDSIRLIQADLLLDNLTINYEPPVITASFRGKCAASREEIVQRLFAPASNLGGRLVMTGSASAEKYATTAGEPMVSLYTTLSPNTLLAAAQLDAKETNRFANLEILRTEDARTFFDARVEGGIPYASPIQTWLELAGGDKRQKDAAQQLKRGILASLGELGDGQR